MKKFLIALIAVVVAAYPFLIYFGLSYFSVRYIAVAIALILLLRFILLRSSRAHASNIILILVTITGLSISLVGAISNNMTIMKLYPVIMSLLLFSVFFYSLLYPPTIIEKIARLTNANLPEKAVKYTQKVTIVWCLFFIMNGGIALWTVFFASMKVWTFYNGFLSYILTGTLFLTEFIVRHFAKKRYHSSHE